MAEWIETLSAPWAWLIIGVILATAEIIMPGFFLIWLAAAAIATGVIAFVVEIPIAGQLGLFAILSILAVYAARRWLIANPIETSDPNLNNRAARLIGEIVTAIEPVDALKGRVKVGDSVWPARGGPAAVGDILRVSAVDSGCLIVEAV